MDVLLVLVVLQTHFKLLGWPQTNQWHTTVILYQVYLFFTECLLSVASKVNANLTLDVLLVPALQTPSQPGWPQTNQWHTCRFILPPSDFYAVVNHQRHQASTLPNKYCQVQLQFVTLKDQDLQEFNLTEPFCLHGSTDHIVKGKPFEMTKTHLFEFDMDAFSRPHLKGGKCSREETICGNEPSNEKYCCET